MTTHTTPRPTWSPELKAGIRKRLFQIAGIFGVYAALLFIPAGRLDWPGAWAMMSLYLALIAVNAVLLFRISPETIARRAEGAGQKGWDRVVSGLWAVTGVAGLVVAGLDTRWGWTAPLAPAVQAAGGAGYALASALFSWAMLSNTYFSTVVRILTASGH